MTSFCERALELVGNCGQNRDNLTSLYNHINAVVPFVGAGLSIPAGYPSWADLLRMLCPRPELQGRVDALLDYGAYEQAAFEIKQHLSPIEFRTKLKASLDAAKLPSIVPGAVGQLPSFAQSVVLTTNLDRVLERVFEQAGRPFTTIYRPSDLRDASGAIQKRERVLLKLHGDYEDNTPILTMEDYDTAYGRSGQVDFDLPLPRLLLQALVGQSLLFVGCSLQRDRTMEIISSVVQKLGVEHFAMVSDRENIGRRREDFSRWNIRPIFYPEGEYRRIELLLELLGRLQSPRGDIYLSSPATGVTGYPGKLQANLSRNEFTVLPENLLEKIRRAATPGIQAVCEKIKILSMDQPIDLASVYNEVNVLSRRAAQRHLSEADVRREALLPDLPTDRVSFVTRKADEKLPGKAALDRHRRLVVWGRPGAGKSTFLKHIALECVSGRNYSQLVPLYFELRRLTHEPAPTDDFIINAASQAWQASTDEVKELLRAGAGLILLDGLDEVATSIRPTHVLHTIDQFATRYPQNRIIVTCRNGTVEYSASYFADVEMADFDDSHVDSFVCRWLRDDRDAKGLLSRLRANSRMHELARNPLLLAMICIVWEDRGDFEGSRARLYEQAFDVLLTKWDAKRRIVRQSPYQGFNKDRVQDLLANIAFKRFSQNQYFFSLASLKPEILKYVSENDLILEASDIDAEALLQSIQSRYGLLTEQASKVWSFSHLTFQEYLVAWSLSQNEDLLQATLHTVADERWREVWLLVCGMKDANYLLPAMLAEANRKVQSDVHLLQCFEGLDEKFSAEIKVEERCKFKGQYVLVASEIVMDGKRYETYLKRWDVEKSNAHDLKLDLSLARILALFREENVAPIGIGNNVPRLRVGSARELFKKQAIPSAQKANPKLVQLLQTHLDRLPTSGDRQWWDNTRTKWTKNFKSALSSTRYVGLDWSLNGSQRRHLKEYIIASRLLEDCLIEAKVLRKSVRAAIKRALYSPSGRIEHAAGA